MTHFATLVICKSPDDLHGLLAPFNENMEAEPYQEECYWCDGTGLYTRPNPLEASDGAPAVNVGDPCPARPGGRWDKGDGNPGCVDGKVWTTYNPKAKWDWFQVGGRFPNRLVANPGSETLGPDLSWTWDDATPEEKERLGYYCSGAKKKDLNWDMMGHMKIENLKANWQRYLEALDEGRPEAQTAWLWDVEIGDDEEAYLRRHMKFEMGAVLTPDGEWHEQGRHGWFGTQEEGMGPDKWNDELQDIIDSADPEYWFIVVDCHI